MDGSSSCRITFLGLVILLGLSWGVIRCEEFGFEFHHRFSDQVVGVLPGEGLPNRDSSKYYRVMAHRDRLIRGRRLGGEDQSLVTFSDGNETVRIDSLGFLHYANVSVGTPSDWFLVALDTGSDLFWLPCDCTNCVRELKSPGRSSKATVVSPKWKLAPTGREQEKWDRATKAATGGSEVMFRELRRPRGDPEVLAAEYREQYFKLKNKLQVLTIGIGGVGLVSAYISYTPEITLSFGAGLMGSLAYMRMLLVEKSWASGHSWKVFYSREDNSLNWYVVMRAPPRGYHELETDEDLGYAPLHVPEVEDLDGEHSDDDSVYVRDDCEGLLVVD